VLALLAWGIRHTLMRAQHELRDFDWQVSWTWLMAAGAFYLAGLVPSAWYWHRVLVALGEPSRAAHTIRAHIFGQLGKYVPGKAMVFVLRIGALRPVPIRAVSAAIAIFYETLTFMAVGALAATIILWAGYRQAGWLIGVSATQYSWKRASGITALHWSDAALMMPLFHACGTVSTPCSRASSAIRSHSVMPPQRVTSGWT